MEIDFRVVNWNIGGAKYLELLPEAECTKPELSREHFKKRLNAELARLIRQHQPHVLTLQEVSEYAEEADEDPDSIIEPLAEYVYLPTILIDTRRHSHQGKWTKVRKKGNWAERSYFGQGNAFLVRKDVSLFPVYSLPALDVSYEDWLRRKGIDLQKVIASRSLVEEAVLQSGLYFGNRNTEPRAASVLHVVLDGELGGSGERLPRPLDLLVVNTHLTTLLREREGIPRIDSQAASKRLKQLSIIFDEMISPYNEWRKDRYTIRDEMPVLEEGIESHDRHNPVWLLAGDFNFTPASEEYEFVRRRNFIDLLEEHPLGTKASGLGEEPTLTVDYVFAGPLFESIDPNYTLKRLGGNRVKVIRESRVSDHYPVLATLSLTPLGGESD